MTNIRTLESRLHAANPLPHSQVPALSPQDARDLANATMDSPLTPEPESGLWDAARERKTASRFTGRRALIAAAVIATTAAGSLLLTSGPAASRAYATWSPTPTPVTGAAADAAANQCRTFLHVGGDLPLIVTERRGIYSYTVLAGVDTIQSCLLSPAKGGQLVGSGGGGGGYDHPLTRPKGSGVVVWSGAIDGAADRDSHFSAIGRSGPEVTGIDVQMPDGTDVKATITDGWWAFWAPGTDQPRQITVHRADGSSAVQAFQFS